MYNSKVGPEARVDVTHLPWVSHFVCAGATPRKCIRVRTLVLPCVTFGAKSLQKILISQYYVYLVSMTVLIKMAVLSQCFVFIWFQLS